MTAAPVPMAATDTFEPYGLGWRAVVGERTTRFTVRRIRHDHGTLRGYIDVEYKAKGKGTQRERLAGEVVNISSGRDRASFANRLSERKPGIDWRNLVDQFCVEVEKRDDEAEPAVWVGTLPAPINGGFLVDGLIERNQTTGIHGDGSTGKSYVATAVSVSVTAGVEIMPGYRPHQRGNVLYLDWETDQDTINYRVQQIARGAGIEPPQILYLRMDGPISDAVERILALVQEHKIILLVVDSVEAAMAGSVSAGASPNEGPSKVNRALRRIGISALLIDHISAEQAQSKEVARKAYGNVFKRNWQRMSFQIKQTREAAPDGLRHLGLFATKRNNGKEADPVGLAWEINDELCRWEREEIDDPELEQALPTAQRIVAYLRREGPSQPSAIAEGTGLSGSTVRPTLTRRSDLFQRTPTGLWDVVKAAPAARFRGNDDEQIEF